MASVQLKRRGKTPGRWYATYRINGKQRNPFTGLTELTATRKEALNAANELYRLETKATKQEINYANIKKAFERVLEHNGYRPVPKWKEYSQSFLALKHGKAVRDNYARIIRYFGEFMGKHNLEIEQIKERDIAGFMFWLERTMNHTPSSQNYALEVLRMIFRMARQDGFVERDPTARIEKRESDTTGKRSFREKEIQAMLNVADEEWKTAILIGQWTGARLGDATRMRGQNFHLDCDVPFIRYTPSKTRRKRKVVEIPLYKPLLAHIKTLPQKDFLTPTLRKNPKGFDKVMKAAGIQRINLTPDAKRSFYDVGFHSFRHTFNAYLKKTGVPEWLRKEIIGWTSDEQKKYGRLTIEEVARMVGL